MFKPWKRSLKTQKNLCVTLLCVRWPQSSRSVFGIAIEILNFGFSSEGFVLPHLYNFTDSGCIYCASYYALATSLATYVFMLNTGTSCRDWPCQLADRDPRNQLHHFW